MKKIALRYFECRGRAQPIRFFLAEKDILFRDIRVPLDSLSDSWKTTKDDPDFSGPFGRLPILDWGDQQISETLVIAFHLHNKFDSFKYDAEHNLLIRSVISSTYTDVISPIGILIWQDVLTPGVDMKKYLFRSMTVFEQLFDRYDQLLRKVGRPFIGGKEPCLADYFVFEALQIYLVVFKPRHLSLQANHSTLATFNDKMTQDPGVKACLASLPSKITGRVDEESRITKIHACLTLHQT